MGRLLSLFAASPMAAAGHQVTGACFHVASPNLRIARWSISAAILPGHSSGIGKAHEQMGGF